MRERRLNTGATVAQDARTPDGRTVLLDLARHCDVLIEISPRRDGPPRPW
jgi:hypothetical protein